ncbi:MAG: hypothetical protein MK052_10375 [Alphaproteobacteria bacterium]|nr:hypothetical protein [Alphaproteobacteria bacterium]
MYRKFNKYLFLGSLLLLGALVSGHYDAANVMAKSDSAEEDKIISLHLTGANSEITLNIPAKYIGPPNSSLAQKLKQGEKAHKLVPLAFMYPEFKPWPENWVERMQAGDKGLNSIILKLSGQEAIRNYNEFFIKAYKENPEKAVAYKGERYGLQTYARKYPESMGG